MRLSTKMENEFPEQEKLPAKACRANKTGWQTGREKKARLANRQKHASKDGDGGLLVLSPPSGAPLQAFLLAQVGKLVNKAHGRATVAAKPRISHLCRVYVF